MKRSERMALAITIVIMSGFGLAISNVSWEGKVEGDQIGLVTRDVAYGSDPLQKMDLCFPSDTSNRRPGLILFHGGGGDKASMQATCKRLANLGYVVAAANYRQEPYGYPIAVEDAGLAYATFVARADVDASRVVAWGASAGGWLAGLLGTQETANKPVCVMANFSPMDMTDPNFRNLGARGRSLAGELFGGVTYAQNPGLYSEASPKTYVTSDDADFAFTRSSNDQLVPRSQITLMQTALTAVGLEASYLEYRGTGTGHANNVSPTEANRIWNFQKGFVERCLR